jgi:hypothetical protein
MNVTRASSERSAAHDSVPAVVIVVLVLETARAADSWVGGALSAGGELMDGVGAIPMQAELDIRAEGEHLYARFDLDVHLQPVHNQEVVSQPYPFEWAMLQVGAGDDPWRLRLGLTNPNVMLEDSDAWNNALPTFSLLFDGAAPGRLLGGEVVAHRPDGTEVFAWGGVDVDFVGYPPIEGDTILVPTVGLGVAGRWESFGTRTGIASWPGGERDVENDAFHGLFGSLDVYPLDPIWVGLDGAVGIHGSAPFAGGALVVQVFPENIVAGVARAEGIVDPGDEALGGAIDGVLDGTASLGTRVRPHESLLLQLELKALFEGGEVSPGGAFLVTWHRPEPAPYTTGEG